MNKSTQKRNRYNSTAVNIIAEKYGYSDRYVRACLDGTRVGIMPDQVKIDYKDAVKQLKETVDRIKKPAKKTS